MRIRILSCILAIFSVAGCSAGGDGSSPASSAGLLLGLMSGAQPQEMGMARVRLRLSSDLLNQNRSQANGAAATAQASVTRVDLRVTGAGIAAPITASLTDSGGGVWSGTVPGIPAGADRAFIARAYDSGNALLYEGSVAGVTVAFEQTAQIMIQMQESNPAAGYSNVAPVIDSFAMSGAQILPGQTVAFAVAASDENAGDTLAYAWTADGIALGWSCSNNPNHKEAKVAELIAKAMRQKADFVCNSGGGVEARNRMYAEIIKRYGHRTEPEIRSAVQIFPTDP